MIIPIAVVVTLKEGLAVKRGGGGRKRGRVI